MGAWDCVYDEDNAVNFGDLIKDFNAGSYDATKADCAQACYFANIKWAGWIGSYDFGMIPNVDEYAESQGQSRPEPIDRDPFYCEAFNFLEDESCHLLSTESFQHVTKENSVLGECFVSRDNPNPCAFGDEESSYQWALSSDGYYYFIANDDGLMEYIEVGESGPATCGTSENVFASVNWPTGMDAAGVYMPYPDDTCDGSADDTASPCKKCIDHMLQRNMVVGMLSAGAVSKDSAKCQLMTTYKTGHACTDDDIALECPAGDFIVITSAHYGRRPGSELCKNPVANTALKAVDEETEGTYDCWNDVLSQIGADCIDNSECTITATTDMALESPDSGGCQELYSYLDVQYHCSSEMGGQSALAGV
jgi:hypothetical protein